MRDSELLRMCKCATVAPVTTSASAYKTLFEEMIRRLEKYRWHDVHDENETERFPEIVSWGQSTNCSEAVEVTDGYKIYDTAMVVERHTDGDCNKVYDRFWYFGEGGKWEEMDNIRAWRYIAQFDKEYR